MAARAPHHGKGTAEVTSVCGRRSRDHHAFSSCTHSQRNFLDSRCSFHPSERRNSYLPCVPFRPSAKKRWSLRWLKAYEPMRRGTHFSRFSEDGTVQALTRSLRFSHPHLESRQADVAQLVEQPIRNRQVNGSSPFVGSRFSQACRSVPCDPRATVVPLIFSSNFLHDIRCGCGRGIAVETMQPYWRSHASE